MFDASEVGTTSENYGNVITIEPHAVLIFWTKSQQWMKVPLFSPSGTFCDLINLPQPVTCSKVRCYRNWQAEKTRYVQQKS